MVCFKYLIRCCIHYNILDLLFVIFVAKTDNINDILMRTNVYSNSPTKNVVVWTEKATKLPRTDTVHGTRLQVHHNGSWDKLVC